MLLIPNKSYNSMIKFCRTQRYVGEVKFIQFDHSAQNTKQILVMTKENVLAAINAKTGELGKALTVLCPYRLFPCIMRKI